MTSIDVSNIIRFLVESNSIEAIYREPTAQEIDETTKFLHGPLNADTVIELQAIYAPKKPLRNKIGMNVRVGAHIPPSGSPTMRANMVSILQMSDPWECHVAFEALHPFMDGNGRTGRSVWLWKMFDTHKDPFSLSFLHRFYYQTLSHLDGKA